MMEVEWSHNNITELIEVKDMHERKKKLIEDIDAVIVLPGGSGTLEETLEVITLKRLGKFTKPIIFINTDGFYDNLFQLFDKMPFIPGALSRVVQKKDGYKRTDGHSWPVALYLVYKP